MQKLFYVVASLLLVPLVTLAQGPPAPPASAPAQAPAPAAPDGAGVVSTSSLKVLTAQNVEVAMQNITFALNLRCIDCHAVPDMTADAKPLKLKAREMLEMTRDINAKLGDGTTTHVTCWTCHRGSRKPETSRPSSK